MWQFILSFAPVGVVGLIVLSNGGDLVTGLVLLALSFAIAIAGYEVPRLERGRLFHAMHHAKEERVYHIGEQEVTASSSFFKVQYEWRTFTSYRETDSLFALFTSPHQLGPWFPKRVLSPEQITELRQLLKAKLSAR
jgi:hypothetical protein